MKASAGTGRRGKTMANRVKYPRTMHLPWSPGATSDDKMLKSVECFNGKNIVITEKMDGENTTLYSDGLHARSTSNSPHPSRNWLKNFHASIKSQIPENVRICGENMFAMHSLHYDNLESYFLAFSAWISDACVSWRDTKIMLTTLGISHVPEIYVGKFDVGIVKEIESEMNFQQSEGYVIRNADYFTFDTFSYNVAKFVRASHVQTDDHWMNRTIAQNKTKENP